MGDVVDSKDRSAERRGDIREVDILLVVSYLSSRSADDN